MPQKEHPDYHDGDFVLRFYEMRREPVMRESRSALVTKFHPLTEADALAILKADHPLNAAYRQVSTYWEMVYGMARNGIVHGDYMMETNGEGLLLYTRIEPWLDAIRATSGPRAFLSAQWVAENTTTGKGLAERFRARQKAAMEANGKQ